MFHSHINSTSLLKLELSGNVWYFWHQKWKIKFAIWMFKLKTVWSQNGCVHDDIIHCGIITLFRGNWVTICFMMNPHFKIPANAFLARLATALSIIIPVSSTLPSDSHKQPCFSQINNPSWREMKKANEWNRNNVIVSHSCEYSDRLFHLRGTTLQFHTVNMPPILRKCSTFKVTHVLKT